VGHDLRLGASCSSNRVIYVTVVPPVSGVSPAVLPPRFCRSALFPPLRAPLQESASVLSCSALAFSPDSGGARVECPAVGGSIPARTVESPACRRCPSLPGCTWPCEWVLPQQPPAPQLARHQERAIVLRGASYVLPVLVRALSCAPGFFLRRCRTHSAPDHILSCRTCTRSRRSLALLVPMV